MPRVRPTLRAQLGARLKSRRVTALAIAGCAAMVACGPPGPTPAAPPPQPATVAVPPPAAPPPTGPLPQDEAEPPVPPGFVEMHVVGVTPDPAVVIADASEKTVVPVFISQDQAMVIELRRSGQKYERPLTHDLFDTLLREAHARLVRVQVDALRDNVFVATLIIRLEGRWLKLDSRTSDAIALALGNHAPIYVAPAVVQRAGVSTDSDLPQEKPQPPPTGAPPAGGNRI